MYLPRIAPLCAYAGGSSQGGAQKLVTAGRSKVVSGSWCLCFEPLGATLTLSGSRVAFLWTRRCHQASQTRLSSGDGTRLPPGPSSRDPQPSDTRSRLEPRPQPAARSAGQEAAGPG